MVNDFFKSKERVVNCMKDRACAHTGNAMEQFLEQLLKQSKNLSSTV